MPHKLSLSSLHSSLSAPVFSSFKCLKLTQENLQRYASHHTPLPASAHINDSQVDEHTTLLLEAARLEVDPNAARKASLRREGRASTIRSRHSGIRSRTSSGPTHPPESESGAPRLHLSHHISNEEVDDLDWSFDDVQSTREIVEKTEEPGIDALRGTFGAIGTIIRAKRRMRALSAASHASQSSTGHHVDEHARSVGSVNVRPSWLVGPWSTPKGSRFQPMHDEHDLEKGTSEMVETRDEKGNIVVLRKPVAASPLALSRVPSPASGHAAASTPIPLHALRNFPSINSGNESMASGSSSSGSQAERAKSSDTARVA